jgi:hypothetical protein
MAAIPFEIHPQRHLTPSHSKQVNQKYTSPGNSLQRLHAKWLMISSPCLPPAPIPIYVHYGINSQDRWAYRFAECEKIFSGSLHNKRQFYPPLSHNQMAVPFGGDSGHGSIFFSSAASNILTPTNIKSDVQLRLQLESTGASFIIPVSLKAN